MTVSLLNYSPIDADTTVGKDWSMYVFLGSGNKFQSIEIKKDEHLKYEEYILEKLPTYKKFVTAAKRLCTNIPNRDILHQLYVENNTKTKELDIETFFDKAEELLLANICDEIMYQTLFTAKENIPVSQFLSIYLLNLYFSRII